MISSDISHKYLEWYFKIVIRNWDNLRQFWNITSGICAKYHEQIMLLFVYATTHKRFVILTCRYFKLSWNTTALSQSGEQGWRSGESARLPPMWPGLKPRCRHVGWLCCWFSALLRGVFLRVPRFSPLPKNQHFQIPIRSGTHGHWKTSS